MNGDRGDDDRWHRRPASMGLTVVVGTLSIVAGSVTVLNWLFNPYETRLSTEVSDRKAAVQHLEDFGKAENTRVMTELKTQKREMFDTVNREVTARVAEVGEQAIQRTADMERLKREIDDLTKRLDVITKEGTTHSNEALAGFASDMRAMRSQQTALAATVEQHMLIAGHPQVLAQLQKLEADLRTEKAERTGSDALSVKERELALKRLDLEMGWNEDQERRFTRVVERLARIEERLKIVPSIQTDTSALRHER